MKYIDICSLYPTVMFYDKFPVGHPIKIFMPEKYNPDWFGYIKFRVLPPKGLYHPVLPIKEEKLIFPLCLKCASNKKQKCSHSDNERAFVGTWTTPEIKKALEKGYKILQIYEVWNFTKTSRNMFKSYISKFQKIKLETSPWEDDYDTKEAYVKDIKNKLGIDLDINNISPNPVLRAMAKLLLNAFYGKFGQRRKMKTTEYIDNPNDLYRILLNSKLDNIYLTEINEKVLEVRYETKDEWLEDPTKTNVIVAAFTTSYVRLRLYKAMDQLEQQVVYHDTDSIIYIDDGINNIKNGCMLGEWTDELSGDNIVEFISTGPKSYAYKTSKGKTVCKIKGFTLNYENSQKLNMDEMRRVLYQEVEV